MNRARRNIHVLRMLLFALTIGVAIDASAQTAQKAPTTQSTQSAQKSTGTRKTQSAPTIPTRAAHPSLGRNVPSRWSDIMKVLGISPPGSRGGRAVRAPGTHPFLPTSLTRVPTYVTRRSVPAKNGRAVGDQTVIRQNELLTKADPTQPYSILPAPSEDEHAFWTTDGRYVFFDSNRTNATNTAPNAANPGGVYNVYQMFPDGTGVTQVLPSTSNQIEPVLANDELTLAFVANGTINFTPGLTKPTTAGFNLFTLNLNSPASTVTQITNLPTAKYDFADVRHPSFTPGTDAIVFAGRLQGQTIYHIFKYTFLTAQYLQLTTGPSNDFCPSISPDGLSVAFSSNAKSFSATGVASGVVNNTDVWTTAANGTIAPTRITNFAVNGVQSSNSDPNWGTIGIAFASNRVDSHNDGVADSIGTTTDIYYVNLPNPESGANKAIKLQTSEPDTAINPADPTYKFDPNHVSNEDYPFVPPANAINGVGQARFLFESDRVTSAALGANLDIYGAENIDIDAPALLKFDPGSNTIVNVQKETGAASAVALSSREFNAGDKVRIAALIVDYQTGVNSVYLQIKCPESAPKSSDGVEHKIFFDGSSPGNVFSGLGFLDAKSVALDPPYEFDAQAVDAQPGSGQPPLANPKGTGKPSLNARFKDPGVNGVGNTGWPGGNLYLPAIDDFTAWTGNLDRPDILAYNNPADPNNLGDQQGGCWMQLFDDGPVSKGGHEPEGETAGDGIFTNTWVTPPNLPSDWIIDVIAYDNALNPDQTQLNKSMNWKIYDNVWGFSTRPFTVNSKCLYVDEYDSGQKFLQGRFNSSIPSENLPYTFIPTESYMTEANFLLEPTQYIDLNITTGPNIGTIESGAVNAALETLGDNSYQDLFCGLPIDQRYDIWRIQCRGPLPLSVLNQYAPHIEVQPGDPTKGGTPINQVVAASCVIWHTPYTGDLFVGPGTILDSSTQNMLTNYVAQGGRIFVTGEDAAWGLSLGGGVPNQFLNNTLHVGYVGDFWTVVPQDNQINLAGARGTGPISWETWYEDGTGCWHFYPWIPAPAVPNDYPPGTTSTYIWDLPGPNGPFQDWVAPNQDSPDIVSFPINGTVTAATPDIAGIDVTSQQGYPVVCWYTDTKANSKIVFSDIGWEGINPGGRQGMGTPVPPFLMYNKRMEMMHNVLDYLRSGSLVGYVRVVNGSGGPAQPLANSYVQAIDQHTGLVAGSALTQADGSYVINGLYPDGIYEMNAVRAGYVSEHLIATQFHGACSTELDFFTTQAQPGNITGTVTVYNTTTPVGGAIVTATDISVPNATNPPVFTATSDPSTGAYSIQVPNSTYLVQITNVTALGYTASVPPSISPVVVAPSQIVSGENFQLKQKPGDLSGKVDIANASGGDTGQPLAGAVVTATATVEGNTVTFTSAPTGANGAYSIQNIDPGTYSVSAARSGYQTSPAQSFTVLSNKNTVSADFALIPIPPGSISGLVATSTGIPVSGATVTETDSIGEQITVQTGAPQTVDGYTFNYTISNVPAGSTVTVTATKAGYTPKPNPDTQTVVITAGQASQGINFVMDPLFVFNNSLSLVSSPYQFTTDGTAGSSLINIATLLSIPTADISDGAFLFATWNSTTQQYVSYPTSPADSFHLGEGYFLQDTDAAVVLALTNPNGIPAPEDSTGAYLPYNIPLQTGWNMIGMPFNQSVDFTSLQVIDNGTPVNVPDAQSGGNPSIGAALWTYQNGAYQVVYSLDPFRGYWLRAFRPVTLVVTPGAGAGKGVFASKTSRALEYTSANNGNWKLELDVSANNLAVAKSTVGINSAAIDGYDRYKMEVAPLVGSRHVALNFNHSDWGRQAGNYAVDVRSAAASTWTFTVTSDVVNTPVTLTWPTLALTGRHQMLLTDLDSNVTFDLHNRASYVIPAGSKPITHHFSLQVEHATRPNLQLTNFAVGMVGSRSTGIAAGINYTLTADAQVEVSISQNGRRIRTLISGDSRSAGASSETWDLKNDRGTTMPAGVYMVEVRAVDSNGYMVHPQMPLVITR